MLRKFLEKIESKDKEMENSKTTTTTKKKGKKIK